MSKRSRSVLIQTLLPFLALGVVLIVQFALAAVLPKRLDFPYVFFYLIAIFIVGWVGCSASGAVACLITMVGIPYLATPGFRFSSLDPNRLALLLGLSL